MSLLHPSGRSRKQRAGAATLTIGFFWKLGAQLEPRVSVTDAHEKKPVVRRDSGLRSHTCQRSRSLPPPERSGCLRAITHLKVSTARLNRSSMPSRTRDGWASRSPAFGGPSKGEPRSWERRARSHPRTVSDNAVDTRDRAGKTSNLTTDQARRVSEPLAERPGEPPVVARLVIEIRSDGSHTIARGAMEDALSGQKVAVEASGTTPLALALSLAKSIVGTPVLARQAFRALVGRKR